MVTDTISDMLTRIRNAINIRHNMVQVPNTKVTRPIAQVLLEEDYIGSFEEFVDEKGYSWLLILLNYSGRGRYKKSVITTLKRISKSSVRVYSKSGHLPRVLGNFGLAIVSTSKGIMSHSQASKLGIGGEILCYLW
jgi:small subunit ribosomal protein S8|tara:strand:+ start:9430 stop:9837 length:408 start_codon:yes stop_codon:yes gene_type:complete